MSGSRADGGFLRSATTVSGLTLLSRILGLARDVATARVLGAGAVNDALTYAWTVPNAFRRLFGEGALSSAFVPVFTRSVEREGRERGREVAAGVISGLAFFLALLTAGLVVAVGALPDSWLRAAFGADGLDKAHLTVDYVRVLLPYLTVICVIAQLTAVMNSLGEFTVPAVTPILLNLVWLAGVAVAAWWGTREPVDDPRPVQGLIVAGAILTASVVQLLWLLPRLSALGMGFVPRWPRLTAELREVLRLMGPMLLGMGAAQLNVLADRTIAMTHLPDGGATHLYYGLRVMQFPLGLVSVALVTTVYPVMARLVARGDREGAAASADLALRTNLLIALPAGAGLMILAAPIVRLLFLGGEFDAHGAERTTAALTGYAAGVPFAGTVMLLTRACYASGDVRLPVRVGLVMVAVNLALDLALVGPLGELGLALATSLTSLLTAIGLAVGVRHRLELSSGWRLARGAIPALAVTAILAGAVAALDGVLASALPEGRGGTALRVGAGVVAGLGVFLLMARRLCPDEWAGLADVWKRGGDRPSDG